MWLGGVRLGVVGLGWVWFGLDSGGLVWCSAAHGKDGLGERVGGSGGGKG